jgi:hypothetical protein
VRGSIGSSNATASRVAGSDRVGEHAAIIYTLIQTAGLNDVGPEARLADVLVCINEHDIQNLA